MLGSIGFNGSLDQMGLAGKLIGKTLGSGAEKTFNELSNPQSFVTNKVVGLLPNNVQDAVYGLAGMSNQVSGGISEGTAMFNPMAQLGSTDKAKNISDDWMKKWGLSDGLGSSTDSSTLLPKNPLSEFKV